MNIFPFFFGKYVMSTFLIHLKMKKKSSNINVNKYTKFRGNCRPTPKSYRFLKELISLLFLYVYLNFRYFYNTFSPHTINKLLKKYIKNN